jgi:hypothetical protein
VKQLKSHTSKTIAYLIWDNKRVENSPVKISNKINKCPHGSIQNDHFIFGKERGWFWMETPALLKIKFTNICQGIHYVKCTLRQNSFN